MESRQFCKHWEQDRFWMVENSCTVLNCNFIQPQKCQDTPLKIINRALIIQEWPKSALDPKLTTFNQAQIKSREQEFSFTSTVRCTYGLKTGANHCGKQNNEMGKDGVKSEKCFHFPKSWQFLFGWWWGIFQAFLMCYQSRILLNFISPTLVLP